MELNKVIIHIKEIKIKCKEQHRYGMDKISWDHLRTFL